MIATGAWEMVQFNPSNMDDTSAHFLEYRSYLFSVFVLFNLNDILGRSIFPDYNNDCAKGALNMVYFPIFS